MRHNTVNVLHYHFSIVVVAVVLLATLACYTTLAIIGSEGTNVLRDALIAQVGVLGGIAIPRNIRPPSPEE